MLYDAIKANVTFHFRIHAPTTVKMSFKDTYQFEKAFNGIFPKYQWPLVATKIISFDIGKSIMASDQNLDEKEEVTVSSNYPFFIIHFDDAVTFS